jgi:hypothetical protein
MDIDSETIPSPPSTIQRETDITSGYPGSPFDMFRDIALGDKKKAYLDSLCKRQRNIQASQGTFRESKRDFRAILQS